MVLLNAVLSSITLYFLSFFKAPKKVLQEIVKIQRSFLWGGVEENKKICWLSWNNVCKTKEEGGLGIKNVEEFNLALLSKWKWPWHFKWSAQFSLSIMLPSCRIRSTYGFLMYIFKGGVEKSGKLVRYLIDI